MESPGLKNSYHEKGLLARNTLCITYIVEFIVIMVSNITLYIFSVVDRNFGVSDTKNCVNLDEYFSQYALLIWKN